MKSARALAPALLLFLLTAPRAWALESILSFDSRVSVLQDGSMTVEETIEVNAEGDRIRRGIYRDFPTDYEANGRRVRVAFEVLSVQRDGRREPFHAERIAGGVRVYVGSADVYLSPGVYRYRIAYRTDRQLGFFEDHDELYWNVTGNGWVFPILEATCRVYLPQGAGKDGLRLEAYTGRAGERGRNYRAAADGNLARFETTGLLHSGEGLTVVVGWPKGFVRPPSFADRVRWFFRDVRSPLAFLLALLAALAYYFVAWWRVGRDPAKDVVIPRFEPPKDLSPAMVRYLGKMGYDNKALAAAVTDLAVKGCLKIDGSEGPIVLVKTGPAPANLPDDEAAALSLVSVGPVALEKQYHSAISGAISRFQTALAKRCEKTLFFPNQGWFLGGCFVSMAATAAASRELDAPWGWALIGSLVVMGVVFFHLLKRRTPLGRKLMDEIEGYRMYLSTTETDRLKRMMAPDVTPQVFEKHLPYAMALDVERQWSSRFAAILAAAGAAAAASYSPSWYSGRWRDFSVDRMTDSLSGLGNTMSSAAVPPGSSSGFSGGGGGGGFSGGGGGGGGGGGW